MTIGKRTKEEWWDCSRPTTYKGPVSHGDWYALVEAAFSKAGFNAGLEAAAHFMGTRRVTASEFYAKELRKLKRGEND